MTNSSSAFPAPARIARSSNSTAIATITCVALASMLASACAKDSKSDTSVTGVSTGDTDGGVMGDTDPCATAGPPSNITTTAATPDENCLNGVGAFLTPSDFGDQESFECDLWLARGAFACPVDEKCMPYDSDDDRVTDATMCVAVVPEPVPVGAACTPAGLDAPQLDPCVRGAICWADEDAGGTCRQICAVDPVTNPAKFPGTIVLQCPASEACVSANSDSLLLCLPSCDPLQGDCANGDSCVAVGHGFACTALADSTPGQAGDVCVHLNDCDSGLVCAAGDQAPGCTATRCCTEFCELEGAPCSDPLAVCTPWFETGQAPYDDTTDFRAVGVCLVDSSVSMITEALEPFSLDNGTSHVGELLITCKSPAGARFGLADFGYDLGEICDALPVCRNQSDFYADIAATLTERAGTSPPPGGNEVIGTGFIDIFDGSVEAAEDIDVALGYGEHTVQACAYDDLSSLIGCAEQVVHVIPPNGVGIASSGATTGEIAAEVGADFIALDGRIGSTHLAGMTNDGQVAVTLPTGFAFPFYGTSYTTVRVQANGGVYFGAGSAALAATNRALPHATAPDLAVLWDDHNPAASGGVWTYYDAQKFIISWENVPHSAGPAGTGVSFQVHLYPDGNYEYHYRDTHYAGAATSLNGGSSATIGSQHPNDSAWLSISHNAPIWGDGKSPRAIKATSDDCVVGSLRFPSWAQCNDPELDVAPQAFVDACERLDGKVWVPAPALPKLCTWPESYRVEGWLVEAGTSAATLSPLSPPRLVSGAAVTAEPGVYLARWYVVNGLKTVSGPYEQLITVAPAYAVKYSAAQNTTYDFVAIAGSGTPLNLGADAEATISLPFSFRYFGGVYTSVNVGANGAVRFDGGDVHYSNAAIPSSLKTSPDIALFWDDLNPASGGGVYTQYDAPNGRFIISWEAVPHHVNVGAGSFQVQLFATGRIELHYQDSDFNTSSYDNGRSATVGIQDHVAGLTSTHNVPISYNTAWSAMSGTARAFQPACEVP